MNYKSKIFLFLKESNQKTLEKNITYLTYFPKWNKYIEFGNLRIKLNFYKLKVIESIT